MIRHIVWWTLKPEAQGRPAAENARLIKEQGLALLDLRAFLVDPLEQHAGHACADVGAAERRQAADQLALQRQGLRLGVDHAHLRRRGRLLFRLLAGSQRDSNGARQGKGAEWGGHQEELRGWFVDGAGDG